MMTTDKYCVIHRYPGSENSSWHVMSKSQASGGGMIVASEENKQFLEDIINRMQADKLFGDAMIVKICSEHKVNHDNDQE